MASALPLRIEPTVPDALTRAVAWTCAKCDARMPKYNLFCGKCGAPRHRNLSPKQRTPERLKNLPKLPMKKKMKSDPVISDPATGVGISFSIFDSKKQMYPELTSKYLNNLKERMVTINWDVKMTSTKAKRKVASWGYKPYGLIEVKDIVPPGLEPLRLIIAAMFQHAATESGQEIIPIQVYLNLYENGNMSTPAHRHRCRQLTLSLGATRTLVVNGNRLPQKHGDIILLKGQKHEVAKEPGIKENRISLNLFFTVKGEKEGAKVNAKRGVVMLPRGKVAEPWANPKIPLLWLPEKGNSLVSKVRLKRRSSSTHTTQTIKGFSKRERGIVKKRSRHKS